MTTMTMLPSMRISSAIRKRRQFPEDIFPLDTIDFWLLFPTDIIFIYFAKSMSNAKSMRNLKMARSWYGDTWVRLRAQYTHTLIFRIYFYAIWLCFTCHISYHQIVNLSRQIPKQRIFRANISTHLSLSNRYDSFLGTRAEEAKKKTHLWKMAFMYTQNLFFIFLFYSYSFRDVWFNDSRECTLAAVAVGRI